MAVTPRQKDYFDTCASYRTKIHSTQTTLNRIRQTGSGGVSVQQQLEKEIKDLTDALQVHR